MTAAELIAKLEMLPPDTIIALEDVDGFPVHVSRTALSVVHSPGVAYIDKSPRVISEEDVS